MARMSSCALAAAVVFACTAPAADALSPEDGCVVVTGATGFVAGHIVEVLLRKGYEVRGTVRDPSNEAKFAHLTTLAAELPGSVSFHKADLLAGSEVYADVLRGCAGLLHVASPATFSTDNPYEAVVRPAVEGTLHALQAAADASTVKSVVVTSSVAAVRPTTAKRVGSGLTYDESDWNDVATLTYGTYPYSKLQAEQAAYKFVDDNKPGFGPLKTIQFPHGFGPQQNARVTSSNQFISHLLLGEVPVILPMCMDVIDVRDVARAHVHVLEHPEASGRYIVAHGESHYMTFADVAASLRRVLPDFPIPSLEAPMWLLRLFGKVDPRLDTYTIEEAAAHCPGLRFDGTRLSRELGFEYAHKDVHATLREAARSMVDLGVADGNRHMIASGYALGAVPVLGVALMAVAAVRCARVGGGSAVSKDKKRQ